MDCANGKTEAVHSISVTLSLLDFQKTQWQKDIQELDAKYLKECSNILALRFDDIREISPTHFSFPYEKCNIHVKVHLDDDTVLVKYWAESELKSRVRECELDNFFSEISKFLWKVREIDASMFCPEN